MSSPPPYRLTVAVGMIDEASASVPPASEGIIVVGLNHLARASVYDCPDTAEVVGDVVVRYHLNAAVSALHGDKASTRECDALRCQRAV